MSTPSRYPVLDIKIKSTRKRSRPSSASSSASASTSSPNTTSSSFADDDGHFPSPLHSSNNNGRSNVPQRTSAPDSWPAMQDQQPARSSPAGRYKPATQKSKKAKRASGGAGLHAITARKGKEKEKEKGKGGAAGHTSSNTDAESKITLPESLESFLLPFQRTGIEFAIEQEGRCLIGDDVRTCLGV